MTKSLLAQDIDKTKDMLREVKIKIGQAHSDLDCGDWECASKTERDQAGKLMSDLYNLHDAIVQLVGI